TLRKQGRALLRVAFRELVGAPHLGPLVVAVLVERLEAAGMLVPGQADAEPMVVGGALTCLRSKGKRCENGCNQYFLHEPAPSNGHRFDRAGSERCRSSFFSAG